MENIGLRRQVVVHGIRITLQLAGFLDHHCHNASHRRRAHGSAAEPLEIVKWSSQITAARTAARTCIRVHLAYDVETAVEKSGPRKKRNIRYVTLAVTRDAGSCLPDWLGIATDAIRYVHRSTRRTSAHASTACLKRSAE